LRLSLLTRLAAEDLTLRVLLGVLINMPFHEQISSFYPIKPAG